jgi:hypothetical protein
MTDLADTLMERGIDVSTLRPALDNGEQIVPVLTVAGGVPAIETRQALRRVGQSAGFWPVLLGDDDDLESHANDMRESRAGSTTDILRRAEEMATDPDPRAWFYRRIGKPVPPDDYHLILGDWPRGVRPNNGFSIPFTFDGEALPRVHIGLFPTTHSWHVPAIMRYGSYNSCPPPVEHAALMKFWRERYLADVVGISHDVIEMVVYRPPQKRAAALELAKQHYSYCTDIVSQSPGEQTLSALAARLIRGRTWHFWWD